MGTALSDYPVEDLREMLRATEQSVGAGSVSAKLIRRELNRKLAENREPSNHPVVKRGGKK